MKESNRPFDGTDLKRTTKNFLNAITANMVMTEPEQTDLPFDQAWISKTGIAVI